jgi:hypothetical protein
MPLSSQQIRPIVRISIDAALGLSYDIYTTEQWLVSNNNQSSMTKRRSFVTASGVYILPIRSLDGRHTRRPRGFSMADHAKQSQSVGLPFGNQRRSRETKPISCGRQGRDGLATETPYGVSTDEIAVRNKAKSGRDGVSGKSQCHVRDRFHRSGGRAKQSQFPGPQLARRPMASGDARPTAQNKANSSAGCRRSRRRMCETKPIGGIRQAGWRSRGAKQSQFPEVGRWRRGSCCAEQSQFAETPDE